MIDYGDCSFDPGFPEKVPQSIYSEAKKILDGGAFLLSMGGDHSISYPLLKAHAEKHGPLSLIQFDSHSDTWAEPEKRFDHGSMFFHAAKEGIINSDSSVQVGIRTMNKSNHGFNIIDANWVHENGIDAGPLAYLLGARVFEKHFTIDQNLPGRDNKFAILPIVESLLTLSFDIYFE